MKKISDFKEHLVLLLEAGFIAANRMDEDSAVKLFKAASLLNKEATLPKVGLGYIHLLKLELKQACRVFEEVLKIEPHNDMAKTLLGLSMTLTTDQVAKGEQLLSDVGTHTSDDQIKLLADNAIDFVEKFVKKGIKPSAYQNNQPKKSH